MKGVFTLLVFHGGEELKAGGFKNSPFVQGDPV